MDVMDWWVVIAGSVGVVLVNWYFFAAGRGASTSSLASAAEVSSGQAATIVVKGGYEPSTIRVKAGRPVHLTFDRQETSGCSEEVVIPGFGIRTFLPAFEQTQITVTPSAPGTYEFTCGMSMLHGRIVAE